jgi:hypothetical protein
VLRRGKSMLPPRKNAASGAGLIGDPGEALVPAEDGENVEDSR